MEIEAELGQAAGSLIFYSNLSSICGVKIGYEDIGGSTLMFISASLKIWRTTWNVLQVSKVMGY